MLPLIRAQGTTGRTSKLSSFYERPILNSPYRAPELHHPLDKNGQPIEGEPRRGRRPSRLLVPVPASRKKASAAQGAFELEEYTDHALINEIRGYLDSWRTLRNPADWGVTGATQRLLEHWRHHDFVGATPFFCQLEAVETIMWLTEVAPKRAATKGPLDRSDVEGPLTGRSIPTTSRGSTRFANFITSEPIWRTGAQPPKCHLSHFMLDSGLEGEACPHPRKPSAHAGQEPGDAGRHPLPSSRYEVHLFRAVLRHQVQVKLASIQCQNSM